MPECKKYKPEREITETMNYDITKGHAGEKSHMANQKYKQFRLDVATYYELHEELGARGSANNLGIYKTRVILGVGDKVRFLC